MTNQAKTRERSETISSVLKINIPASQFLKNNKVYDHISYIPLPDTRIIALKHFLEDHRSPMANYAAYIIQQADLYNQDWRIIIAISGVESAFGRIIKQNSYNAWGWKGGPKGNFSYFSNWQDAISSITRQFTLGYGREPNPYDIYKTYCPPCTQAWPKGVINYMTQLQNYRKKVNEQLKKQYLVK